MLQKGDFLHIPKASHETFKSQNVTKAEAAALSKFGAPLNPLSSFPLKNKTVFHAPQLENELVIRKLSFNLKKIFKSRNRGRSSIVKSLSLLLEEGIPMRVYRLDVQSFYESFQDAEVNSKIDSLAELSPHSKTLLHSLLVNHKSLGGTGVPRGLSLSATLSDLMMEEFDHQIFSSDDVYFYARYVDDIIIITSCQEHTKSFLRKIEKTLPNGLILNPHKKTIAEAVNRVTPTHSPHTPVSTLNFDYLGYCFSVSEPKKQSKKKELAHFREVTIDIADAKVKKIKMRIVRSFLDFQKTNDWPLLFSRIQFLTQNFSVYNSKVGSKKLAGIYHSYPQVSDSAQSLSALDAFLRNATLSKTGRLFAKTSLKLSGEQKRQILTQSFSRGHTNRNFVHFPGTRIKEIQECWKN